MDKRQTALVLGATGGIGGEVERQLRDTGWAVRALQRNVVPEQDRRQGITWLKGDALNPGDVEAAAEGCSVIVHAVNPPGYRNWAGLVLPMLDSTLAAARKTGASILLPGTVYNYGPDAFPLLTEASPQQPRTRKGAIRVEMEQRLQDYAQSAGGARVLVVRAGDFFGPRAGNNWFGQGLVRPGRAVTVINNPGRTGVGHQWSYLPDVARVAVALLERRRALEPFSCFHLGGHWDADGTQMIEAIRRVVIRHTGRAPKIKAFPWWLARLVAPFQETLRELMELRYLWQQPVRMDNAKLVSVLGRESVTPLEQAVEETLRGLDCLPES
ncbi:NAD-dependent epimerase/dehydratase family protein [Microbulbifer halophilus]|uniref:NAD-dependent epimerase/dehydratase family protein n=1 Tax=Microbulbifer halophilus TaxID=453963 RepID=A0ABW5EGJ1_9GAMM|nr:NAD-dependent epimerase/dehydratase family protein [Microbulbifer halophilus]MCW8128157.1 NAD(P)H-binding protein [Microbulbifer halophilus]